MLHMHTMDLLKYSHSFRTWLVPNKSINTIAQNLQDIYDKALSWMSLHMYQIEKHPQARLGHN